eukprot:UN00142
MIFSIFQYFFYKIIVGTILYDFFNSLVFFINHSGYYIEFPEITCLFGIIFEKFPKYSKFSKTFWKKSGGY